MNATLRRGEADIFSIRMMTIIRSGCRKILPATANIFAYNATMRMCYK